MNLNLALAEIRRLKLIAQQIGATLLVLLPQYLSAQIG